MNLCFGRIIQATGEGFSLPQNSKVGGDTLSCITLAELLGVEVYQAANPCRVLKNRKY